MNYDYRVSLILFLLVVFVVWSFIVYYRRPKVRSASTGRLSLFKNPKDYIDSTPDAPDGFGYKTQWLAMPTDDPQPVIELLELKDVAATNWRSGLHITYEFYDKCVFVSPTVNGWVFVVGAIPLADLLRKDQFCQFVEGLGRHFPTVCYFGSHRVSSFYAWARVRNGVLERIFSHGDGQQWELGEQTCEEMELGFDFFESEPPEGEGETYWEREDLRFPNEEDVIQLAGEWSINPLDLEGMDLAPSTGWIGELPRKNL